MSCTDNFVVLFSYCQSSSRNDTVDTLGGASNLTSETDAPVLEMNGNSVGAKVNVDNGKANSAAIGANVENGTKPEVMALPGITENSVSETTSSRSGLSSESPAASTAATVKAITPEEGKKPDSNGEANCSTSGEDDDEDDTDWDEYHKHFSNTPQSYMRLLYAMPHTRRYFMARSLPMQRDRKRSGCRKSQCQVDHGHGEGTMNGGGSQCGKTLKRLSCVLEGNSSGFAKKQKLGNGHEESCNGDGVNDVEGSGSEPITVLRERLQSNGACQAEESVLRAADAAQNGDCSMIGSVGQTGNGSSAKGSNGAVNGFADVLKQPESSHFGNGLRAVEKDVDPDRCSKAAVIARMNSFHSKANGLYDFEGKLEKLSCPRNKGSRFHCHLNLSCSIRYSSVA